ncbi:MAG: protein phosphatase 2C domain-containing protein, partial [Roseiflexus sp.]
MAHTITMPFDEGMLSHRGRVRTLNEDSVGSFRSVPGLLAASDNAEALRRKGYLYVVADGMGGHDCGDLASATAVQNICASYYADPDDDPVASLERAVAQANKAIYDTSKARRTGTGSPQGQTRPMGTTVTCAVILQDRLVLAHVGDSRAYRLRGNTLSCLTTDHDWISEQMRLHGISREEAERRATARGARGALLRALGVQAEVQPDILTFDWQANDVLLLCSDGLHGLVSDDIIRHILASYPAPLAARTLINAANSAGGHDNVTAVIVRGAPLPALLHQRRWQRLILASALAGACLFVALGLATRAANGQPLAVASHVLRLAGLPTLPPTVALLPTSTSTATMPSSPTATATAAAIPTFTASPQAARPPIKPPPTRHPAQSFSGMPQPVQSPQVNIPEMPIVSPEPSPAISFPTSSVMPSVTSTPTEHPQPPQRPPLPEAPPPPDSGKPPALPTVAPTAPPSVLPTVAPTAPPSVLPTVAPTAPPTVAPTAPPSVLPTVAPT